MKESFWFEVENMSNLLTVIAVGVTLKYGPQRVHFVMFSPFSNESWWYSNNIHWAHRNECSTLTIYYIVRVT